MNKKKPTGPKKWKVLLTIITAATIFWFMAKINKKYDHVVDIPLKIILNNPEFTLKHPPPETVRINIFGRGFDILRLPFYEPTFDVDLSAIEDNYVFPLNDYINNVRLPDELQINVKSVITPHQIDFELDKRVSRRLPVKVISTVKTEAGYTLVDAATIPDSVTITGPAVYLDTLKAIMTSPVNHQAIKAAFQEELSVGADSRFYHQLDYRKIDVFYNVQRLAEKELTGVSVKVINVPDNFEVVPLPGQTRIYVKGGEKILAASKAADFQVLIDFKKDWAPGVDRITPELTTELKVLQYSSIPPDFELIVQKKRAR